jgi:UDP-N-acetylglucosamine--N-acetylmuramyl-(pentapeptide) pyrophosphoryl-undecaprenol N-acetylglucosamine transferase
MKVIIAGGGTGGHLFPGMAIAQEFLERDRDNKVLFIGTRRGIENRILRKEGYELRFIDIEGLRRRGMLRGVNVLMKTPKSMYQSYKILNDFNPDIVLGVGGYAAGPVLFMAYIMGFNTAIHEQNSIPGFTNRILGRFVRMIFISFPETYTWFPSGKTFLTGNPVRKELVMNGLNNYKKDKFTLLILGGSQGSHEVNISVLDSMDYLSEFIDSIRIIHQSGDRDYEFLLNGYRRRGIDATVIPFIDYMKEVYIKADLVISRAGATTLSEIAIFGKPSILIPFPHAANNHQFKNAKILENKRAARVIENPNGKKLAENIIELYKDSNLLENMRINAKKIAKPDAAKKIVDLCIGK